jgi:hypothetical protein
MRFKEDWIHLVHCQWLAVVNTVMKLQELDYLSKCRVSLSRDCSVVICGYEGCVN